MKLQKMMKLGPVAMGCLVFASVEMVLLPSVEAAPVEVTQSEEGTVSVIVAEGKTLTYSLNGEIVKVEGGSSIQIPAGAKDIFFPLGSIVTVKRAAVAKPFTYTVVRNVTLGGVTKPELKKHSTAFVLNQVPGVKSQAGSKIENAFVNPATQGGSAGTDFN